MGHPAQAQCILFRRYPQVLAPFKYGGYPLLLGTVTLPQDSEESTTAHFLGTEKAPLLEVVPSPAWSPVSLFGALALVRSHNSNEKRPLRRPERSIGTDILFCLCALAD
jgi:hypothetical protein